jgi:hypothetical protein
MKIFIHCKLLGPTNVPRWCGEDTVLTVIEHMYLLRENTHYNNNKKHPTYILIKKDDKEVEYNTRYSSTRFLASGFFS